MTIPFYTPPELLDAQALSLVQLAQACRTDTAWIVQRVTTGVLACDPAADDQTPQQWRFSTQTVIRARRIADLAGAAELNTRHIAEAIQYRRLAKE